MSNIKEKIPTQQKLEESLDKVMSSHLPDFLSSTYARREELAVNRKLAILSTFFALALLIALTVIQETRGDTWVFRILVGCAIVWLLVVLLSGRKWLTNSRLLAQEMNMALVPIFTNTLDRMLMYTCDPGNAEETKSLLQESSLITLDDKLDIFSDDVYVVYGENDLFVRELMVVKEEKNRDGKLDSKTILFKGVFVNVQLNKNHDAETYVSTEGDKRGFAHQTFWSKILDDSVAQETILEWNDFEKDLHVASTNPVTARELLSPEFMQDLHSWWSEHKLNMRIAFKGNKMFMLLPETSIKIGISTSSTKPAVIKKYAMSLLRPIWRSLALVESVSK